VTSEELVHHGDGGGAVHVIVAVQQNLFTLLEGLLEAGNSGVHVFHQKRVVQVRPFGAEECLCFIVSGDAPLRQQTAEHGMDFQDLLEVADDGFVSGQKGPAFSHLKGIPWVKKLV
jgi:hypothetical protein